MKHFELPSAFLRFGVMAFLIGINQLFSQSQMPLDNATLQTLRTKPTAEIERISADWASSQIAALGRNGAASALTQLVSDNAETSEHIALLRRFGARIEPEFSLSVLSKIEASDAPTTKGRLLYLLRDTDPKRTDDIEKWLADVRPAEELTNRSAANGAAPFRVCDIAYNVLQEVRASDKTAVQLLTRSETTEARDVRIAQTRKQPAPPENSKPSGGVETSPELPPIVTSSPTPIVRETKPQAPSDETTSSTPWSAVAVLIVAAIGLLWFLLKKEKVSGL